MKLAHRFRRRVGQEKEKLAGRYLSRRGLKILLYNYQCRTGEIDLIARDSECLVFVEVKYRANDAWGEPQAFVTLGKQRKIIRCARYFLSGKPRLADQDCRFDVVAITDSAADGSCHIDWIRNAFQLSDL